MSYEPVRLMGRGGNKRIYLVRNSVTGEERVHAVFENAGYYSEEVVIGILLQNHYCFNIVKYFGYDEQDHLPTEPAAVAEPNDGYYRYQGRYTVIKMELANEGDVASYITKMHEKGRPLPHDIGKALLFQEAVGIAVVHATGAVHQDIKESNIFLHRHGKSGAPLLLGYYIHGADFDVESHGLIPKVGDYGTAQLLRGGHLPPRRARIIAPELASPEALILGDAAIQSPAQDAFCYGYNMVHVMSGSAPTYIIMDDVRCPPSLMEQLCRHWEDEGGDTKYSVVANSIANLRYQAELRADADEDDDHGNANPDDKRHKDLYHAYYRLLVLTATPKRHRFALPDLDSDSAMAQTTIWKATVAWLKPNGPNAEQFHRDCEQFNLRMGNNPHIKRAREGLDEQGYFGVDLVLSLLRLDPDKRFTMKDVILSGYMGEFRVAANAHSVEATMTFLLWDDNDE